MRRRGEERLAWRISFALGRKRARARAQLSTCSLSSLSSLLAPLSPLYQYVCTTLILYFVRTPRHLEALFFANTCNSIMWWTYAKAAWRAGMAAAGAGGLSFKTTLKGGESLQNSALRDLWVAVLTVGGLLASAIAGTVKLASGPTLRSPLAISVLWCVYAALPPLLAVLYGYVSRGGPVLAASCRLAIVASFMAGGLAVFLLFGLYPAKVEYGRVLQAAGFLFEANQVGTWPYGGTPAVPVSVSGGVSALTAVAALALNASIAAAAAPVGAAVEAADPTIAAFNPPVWRGDALLQEKTAGPGGSDISGGWLVGGAGGNLKHTVPSAFATALLAWSLISFEDAHKAAGTGARTANAVRVGADWLMKATGGLANGALPAEIVYQVGNYTADKVK